jgi:hypothetical protein
MLAITMVACCGLLECSARRAFGVEGHACGVQALSLPGTGGAYARANNYRGES